MDTKIDECAHNRFGLDYLYPYQRLVITNIVTAVQARGVESDGAAISRNDDRRGRDSEEPDDTLGADPQADAATLGRQIVILPTGAGKSLCFQLPAALFSGTTLVVYPLLSLMNDQERRICDAGFVVHQLKGGQIAEERRRIADDLAAGRCDFVLTNPETLQSDTVRNMLRTGNVVHAVVDEAHCISEWGDTFRQSYQTLGDSIAAIDIPIITAFTATASDTVIGRIREVLFPTTGAHLIRGNPDRENITYSVVPCLSVRHAVARLAETSVPGETSTLSVWRVGEDLRVPAIVFCRTRGETELMARVVASKLGEDRAFYYHAGLPRDEKKRVESAFFAADDAILCATCAYGMGVDKKNIRTVVHTYLPDTAEAFLQESGRGGRDRLPAQSIVLVSPEVLLHAQRRAAEHRETTVERALLGTRCRRESLLAHFGVEMAACSGCDRCDDEAHRYTAPAAEVLIDTVRRARRSLSTTEWIAVWRGRISLRSRRAGDAGLPGFGTFSRWSAVELESVTTMLIRSGVLALRGNRLVVTPQYRRVGGKTGRRRSYLSFEIGAR